MSCSFRGASPNPRLRRTPGTTPLHRFTAHRHQCELGGAGRPDQGGCAVPCSSQILSASDSPGVRRSRGRRRSRLFAGRPRESDRLVDQPGFRDVARSRSSSSCVLPHRYRWPNWCVELIGSRSAAWHGCCRAHERSPRPKADRSVIGFGAGDATHLHHGRVRRLVRRGA